MELLKYNVDSAMEIAHNPYQGAYKRVLCVCSAGILRSATAAVVLSQPPYNFNTRAAGCHSYALIPINKALLKWAQEIVCMTQEHEAKLRSITDKPIICLDIPDIYSYRDPDLVLAIKERYDHQAAKNPQGQ